MAYKEDNSLWTKKGATLTDKSAQKEYKLTQQEIFDAIKAGKLDYRRNYLYGNPCLKLFRNQVEALVKGKYGSRHLANKKLNAELSKVNTAIRSLKRKIAQLEKRKKELLDTPDS
jgi:hypothetical protein